MIPIIGGGLAAVDVRNPALTSLGIHLLDVRAASQAVLGAEGLARSRIEWDLLDPAYHRSRNKAGNNNKARLGGVERAGGHGRRCRRGNGTHPVDFSHRVFTG